MRLSKAARTLLLSKKTSSTDTKAVDRLHKLKLIYPRAYIATEGSKKTEVLFTVTDAGKRARRELRKQLKARRQPA